MCMHAGGGRYRHQLAEIRQAAATEAAAASQAPSTATVAWNEGARSRRRAAGPSSSAGGGDWDARSMASVPTGGAPPPARETRTSLLRHAWTAQATSHLRSGGGGALEAAGGSVVGEEEDNPWEDEEERNPLEQQGDDVSLGVRGRATVPPQSVPVQPRTPSETSMHRRPAASVTQPEEEGDLSPLEESEDEGDERIDAWESPLSSSSSAGEGDEGGRSSVDPEEARAAQQRVLEQQRRQRQQQQQRQAAGVHHMTATGLVFPLFAGSDAPPPMSRARRWARWIPSPLPSPR